ncbi:SMC-Scp complex subunit ScpB [Botrimarina hoheduenensis]|uniref:Segregation and condensation protein B n=1 Tax=Botrimarina hoheduenensis TaxID=2528000 RepID=A0A5C5W8D8_9BACT|nr:SMC-Scp complex subunit ScpB [Botrimarina hoheduenensis]TWT46864.1 Segregation and condensation protein B [Botrimarina hoheduenensis]
MQNRRPITGIQRLAPRAYAAAWDRGRSPSTHRFVRRTKSGSVAEAPVVETRVARVEALLWLASEPLTDRQLALAAALSGPSEAREAIETLVERYRRRGSGLEIAAVAGGFQLLTQPQYAPWIASEASLAPGLSITPAALETLSVVAGTQPVVRAEIEAIRGVGCGELLRQLLEADLLRIVGRSGELGKPLVYGTTNRFLRVFGLRNLAELPLAKQSTETSEPTNQNAPVSL